MPPAQASDAAAQEAAQSYQRQQATSAAAAAAAAVVAWRAIDAKALDASWPRVLARMMTAIAGAQRKAAAAVPAYTGQLLRLQGAAPSGVRLSDGAFAGLTGDGRPLAGLLYAPVALSKQRIGRGEPIPGVMRDEEKHVAVLAKTVVADTQRMALQTQMAAEPAIRGYVRKVNLPACPRCIILSGRFYRYSDGFLRHPGCDCTMIPVAAGSDMVHAEDPADLIARMRSEYPERLRKSLAEGDLKALDRGGDLNQVVNAHRGLATAAGYGKRLKVTSEGTTKRGFAGQRLARESGLKSGGRYRRARSPRLTPAQIFDIAGEEGWSEDEILRQLKRFSYVI